MARDFSERPSFGRGARIERLGLRHGCSAFSMAPKPARSPCRHVVRVARSVRESQILRPPSPRASIARARASRCALQISTLRLEKQTRAQVLRCDHDYRSAVAQQCRGASRGARRASDHRHRDARAAARGTVVDRAPVRAARAAPGCVARRAADASSTATRSDRGRVRRAGRRAPRGASPAARCRRSAHSAPGFRPRIA